MQEQLVLLKRIRENNNAPVLDIEDYERMGGYAALKKAIKTDAPEEIIKIVKESGLRGRGGAGFSTGMKWGFVPQGPDSPGPKFLVCNCDEMEPGTFKDRLLIERDPHQLIEGMILAAYAMNMDIGYIYVRWAYQTGAKRLKKPSPWPMTKAISAKIFWEPDSTLSSMSNRVPVVISSAKRQPCSTP